MIRVLLAVAIDFYWIACFAIALYYALRSRRLAIEDRVELIAERMNGAALIEAKVAIRRATFRVAISTAMLAIGIAGLAVPQDVVRGIFTVGFITFATVYALQARLDDRDRARTLDLLKKL